LPSALTVPSIALPFTRPWYSAPPALKLIWSPFSLPREIGADTLPDLSVPEIFWKSCLRTSSPGPFYQPPSTCAGTIHK